MNIAATNQTETPIGDRKKELWREAFRQRSVWFRAVKLGLTTGLLQASINQGDHWLAGAVDGRVIFKTIISPMIGFTLVLITAAETWVQRTIEREDYEGN